MTRLVSKIEDPNDRIRECPYEAFVIDAIDQLDDDIMVLVYVLKTPSTAEHLEKTVFGVHKTGFELNVDTRNLGEEEKSLYRRIKKRLAEPLQFGDRVFWKEDDMDLANRTIFKFSRERPSCGLRSFHMQVGGIVNPSKPEFWNDLQPFNISEEEWKSVEPDVYIEAWVTVDATGKTARDADVRFSLVEFFDIGNFDIDKQDKVNDAPWNRSDKNSKYKYFIMNDTENEDYDCGIDVEEDVPVKGPTNEWQQAVIGQLGLFVGDRLMFSKDLHQYDFIIPVIKPHWTKFAAKTDLVPIYDSPGEFYYFDAQWSIIHRKFFVTKMDRTFDKKIYRLARNGNLSVEVVVSKKHQGLYHESNLGLIDDPHDKLALFKMLPRFNYHMTASVDVRPVRASENKSVRFRVVQRYDEDRMYTNKQWMNGTEFISEDIVGIVISNCFVFAPSYPNIQFRIPERFQNKYELGTNLRFDAIHYEGDDYEMTVGNERIIPSRIEVFEIVRRYLKPLAHMESTLLQVFLKRDAKYEQLAWSKEFGAIDTRDVLLTDKEFNGWIRPSPVVNGTRQASTIFELVSTSNQPPMGVQPPERVTTNCSRRHNSENFWFDNERFDQRSETGALEEFDRQSYSSYRDDCSNNYNSASSRRYDRTEDFSQRYDDTRPTSHSSNVYNSDRYNRYPRSECDNYRSFSQNNRNSERSERSSGSSRSETGSRSSEEYDRENYSSNRNNFSNNDNSRNFRQNDRSSDCSQRFNQPHRSGAGPRTSEEYGRQGHFSNRTNYSNDNYYRQNNRTSDTSQGFNRNSDNGSRGSREYGRQSYSSNRY